MTARSLIFFSCCVGANALLASGVHVPSITLAPKRFDLIEMGHRGTRRKRKAKSCSDAHLGTATCDVPQTLRVAKAVAVAVEVPGVDEVIDVGRRGLTRKRKATSLSDAKLRTAQDSPQTLRVVKVEAPAPDVVIELELEQVAEPVAEKELTPTQVEAAVKVLQAELSRADRKACQEALVVAGGEVEVAKAALLAKYGAEWEAAEIALNDFIVAQEEARRIASQKAQAAAEAATRRRQQAIFDKHNAARKFGGFVGGLNTISYSPGADGPGRLTQLSRAHVLSLGQKSEEEAVWAAASAQDAEAEVEAACVARAHATRIEEREAAKQRGLAAAARAAQFLETEVGALRMQAHACARRFPALPHPP